MIIIFTTEGIARVGLGVRIFYRVESNHKLMAQTGARNGQTNPVVEEHKAAITIARLIKLDIIMFSCWSRLRSIPNRRQRGPLYKDRFGATRGFRSSRDATTSILTQKLRSPIFFCNGVGPRQLYDIVSNSAKLTPRNGPIMRFYRAKRPVAQRIYGKSGAA